MKKLLGILLLLALLGGVAFSHLLADDAHDADELPQPRATAAPTPTPRPYGTVGEGGAFWRVYPDGTLVVQAGTVEPCDYMWYHGASSPWRLFRHQIHTVRFTGPIEPGGSLEGFFAQLGRLEAIEGLEYLNIENVTNMRRMFANAGIESLDLSDWDTRHVTDMQDMFLGTYDLQELILGEYFVFREYAGLGDRVRDTDPRYATRWRSQGPDGDFIISSMALTATYDAAMAGTFTRIWHRRDVADLLAAPTAIEDVFFDARVAAELARYLGYYPRLHTPVTTYRLRYMAYLNLVPEVWQSTDHTIYSLEGMQHLTGLRNLTFSPHLSLDLSPLAALPYLEGIRFSQRTPTDIDLSPLAEAPNLRALTWRAVSATALLNIAELQQLESLTVFTGSINISPIGQMVNLRELNLRHPYGYAWNLTSSTPDLRPLASLVDLETLTLNRQGITLPTRHAASTLIIENNVFDVDGARVAPSYISHGGTYNEPYITWTDIPENLNEVYYGFSQYVTVGNATARFYGRVRQPLVSPDSEITQWVSVSFTLPNPVGYVTVALRAGSPDGEVIATMTDRVSVGNATTPIGFTFHDVPSGTYSLVFSQPGHTSFTIYNVVVTPGSNLLLSQDPRFPRRLPLYPGNISGSGQVNIGDLSILLQNWMGYYTYANLTGSGQVNISDLNLLLRNWMAESVELNWTDAPSVED